eukprot:5894356-Pleurochrysis_carterae.AAC.1
MKGENVLRQAKTRRAGFAVHSETPPCFSLLDLVAIALNCAAEHTPERDQPRSLEGHCCVSASAGTDASLCAMKSALPVAAIQL